MNNQIILTEYLDERNNKLLASPIIDGYHAAKMREHLIEQYNESITDSIFNNALKCLNFYSNPKYNSKYENNLSKILCLGRVQSGKTGFFISAVSLAFDNGYDIAYLIGGTKNTLKNQNFDRISSEFENNPKVKIFDINEVDSKEIIEQIENDKKVIIVSLKNAASNVNLGKGVQLSSILSKYPSIVVDDEGDEYTPGAPNLKKKNAFAGANHDKIVEIIKNINNVSYLSVTATPQANLLLSTIDEVSPDYAVLVEPGDEYTGGNAFHDTKDNTHVVSINDYDNFKDSVPESFKDALNFFIFCACLTKARKNDMALSMLVHPSALTRIQNSVSEKIEVLLTVQIEAMLDKTKITREEIINDILKQKENYLKMNFLKELDVSDEDIISNIDYVALNLLPFVFNTSEIGKQDIEREKNDKHKYKIYIGGNMLGRGLTIKNLIVTYMYRDSKVTAIDTLYQRARWLGYKGKYFDLCRVYMTNSLIDKFISIVDNENDMWNAFKTFLNTKIDIKEFPRIFTISGEENLILTRKTVSKTIVLERVSEGFQYDTTLWLTDEAKKENRELYYNYFNKYKNVGEEHNYTLNGRQNHLVINTSFSQFYNDFLSKYNFPSGSKFGIKGFEKILDQIKQGICEDMLSVIIMRYKTKEYRTSHSVGLRKFIGELLQSYDNGTGYTGDKNLPDFENKHYFQIHLVYDDKNNPEDFVPLLAYNNPISKKTIKYVTGENYYE